MSDLLMEARLQEGVDGEVGGKMESEIGMGLTMPDNT
jgi:hypothetical protein